MKEEAAPFRKLVVGRDDVCVLVTGIGRGNTERALRKFFANNSPRQVFTCGLAGGLDPKLVLGEVIFSTADAALEKALIKARACQAKFVCAPTIATTVAEKQKLRTTTQADAVEMESEVVHEMCQEQGIPCATVRVISDTAHEDLPLDFNQLSNPDQSLNFGKLALTIAKSPGKIPALLRLQKNTNFAAKRLAEVLERLV